MKLAFFSAKDYERPYFDAAFADHDSLSYFNNQLRADTAELAKGHDAIIAFVNDDLGRDCLKVLSQCGVKLICLRCAGFNQVDLEAAQELGFSVLRVPEYSPYAVAEHALALLQSVNRHIHKAYVRVRENNFALNGLLGFDLRGKTVGVVGTGKIGRVFCQLLSGFSCEILAYDPHPDEKLQQSGVKYVDLPELLARSKVISLHCPLLPATKHLMDDKAFETCQDGLVLVNTSRGALVDSRALIRALKSKKIGAVALDVYEEEGGIFFEDLSDSVIEDDVLMRLMTFPNVLITSHQAFFTDEAMRNIAETTADNVRAYKNGTPLTNEVKA